MNRQISKVCVVGLGKLGIPFAACLGSKGFEVFGVDTNPQRIAMLNDGEMPVRERGVDELLRAHRQNLVFGTDVQAAVLASDATFIVVATPSDSGGSFSLCQVLPACEAVGRSLRIKSKFHLVVVTSTVMPGSTESAVRGALENASGRRAGVDFGLCYNPEFIALGSVIHDMLNPDFILIGESDPFAGSLLESLYRKLCNNNPRIARMSIVNAELTKIAVNSYVTMKISFANNLSEICENIAGADVNVVTSALGLDSRIGEKYIKAALGYGGPCFPRDNAAFSCLARQVGAHATMAEATDAVNRRQVLRLHKMVASHLPPHGTVGILGLSYKPNTDVTERSQGLELAEMLCSEGIPTVVYDPLAVEQSRSLLGERTRYACSMEDCIRSSDVVVLTTAWPQFRAIDAGLVGRNPHQRVLIDCWGLLSREAIGEVAQLVTIGSGTNAGR
jgi:UDPglucose 6-dehydrogenase